MTRDALAFVAAFVGGAINSVAGGGTLVTFPTLIWLGLPSITASATSTTALCPGTIAAIWGFRRELKAMPRRLFALIVPSIVGGLLGAALLQLTPAPVFDQLVPILILFATVLFMLQEPIQRGLGTSTAPHHGGRWLAGAMAFQLLVGVYGGYFGAGIGILMLAALSIIGLTDIHEMNAVKNLLALYINGIAMLYFIGMGMVSWPEAIVMAIGAMAGGIGGAEFARRIGRRAVRWLVVAIGLAMTAVLWRRI